MCLKGAWRWSASSSSRSMGPSPLSVNGACSSLKIWIQGEGCGDCSHTVVGGPDGHVAFSYANIKWGRDWERRVLLKVPYPETCIFMCLSKTQGCNCADKWRWIEWKVSTIRRIHGSAAHLKNLLNTWPWMRDDITCLRIFCSLMSFCRSLLGLLTMISRTSWPLLGMSTTKKTRSSRSLVTALMVKKRDGGREMTHVYQVPGGETLHPVPPL